MEPGKQIHWSVFFNALLAYMLLINIEFHESPGWYDCPLSDKGELEAKAVRQKSTANLNVRVSKREQYTPHRRE